MQQRAIEIGIERERDMQAYIERLLFEFEIERKFLHARLREMDDITGRVLDIWSQR